MDLCNLHRSIVVEFCCVPADPFLTLARNSHQPTAAGVHLPESTALRSDKGLDVLSSTPARFVSLAPCISGHLHALASRSGEKCGLACCRVKDTVRRQFQVQVLPTLTPVTGYINGAAAA